MILGQNAKNNVKLSLKLSYYCNLLKLAYGNKVIEALLVETSLGVVSISVLALLPQCCGYLFLMSNSCMAKGVSALFVIISMHVISVYASVICICNGFFIWTFSDHNKSRAGKIHLEPNNNIQIVFSTFSVKQ